MNWKYTLFDYILVLLLLCFSGNPAFVSVPITRELYMGMTLFVAVMCIIKKRLDIFSKFLRYSLFFFFLFVLQLVILDASLSSVIFYILKIFIGCGVFLLVSDKFSAIYVQIMAVLSVISLFFFVYNLRVGLIPGILTSDHTFSIYIYTQLVSASGVFIVRNSGMFWEPGAFQGYINIALFFLLSKSNLKKKELLLVVIFITTIVTTFSTAGYIIMGLLLIYYVIQNKKMPVAQKALIAIVLVLIFVHYYTSLDILGNKVSNQLSVEGMEESRLSDHIRFSTLIMNHPIIGNSFIDDVFSGNGIVLQLVFIGFSGVLYYWITLFRSISKQISLRMTFFFVLMIFLSLLGEVFIMYPMYLALLFIKIKLKTDDYSKNY